jgi:hypothetical protein
VIEGLYRSAQLRAPVALGEYRPGSHPTPGQVIQRPAVKEPELVHATPPSGQS